jgi:hypothetical protein
MVVGFLEVAVAANADDDDAYESGGKGAHILQDQVSLLLCAMKLLLYHNAAQDYFSRLNGYIALGGLVDIVVSRIGLKYFAYLDVKRTAGAEGVHAGGENDDDENECFSNDGKMNVALVLLSLIFGQPLNADDVEAHGDVTYTAAVRRDLLVHNSRVLDIAVRLAQSSSSRDNAAGLHVLENMLRLSPLSVIALENSGGLGALGHVLTRSSLACALLSAGPAHSSEDPSSSSSVDDLSVFRSASNILVKVAVLNSEVNVNVLAFFTFLLHENARYHHRCLSSHNSSSPLSAAGGGGADAGAAPAVQSSPPPRCANCETEAAVFECTDGSCICDEMFHLCVECDKVFHKSVLKRSHIRIPIMTEVSSDALLEEMGGEFKAVVEGQMMCMCTGRGVSCFDREVWEDGTGGHERKEFLAHASCLLLTHIRAIINDRQVGEIDRYVSSSNNT